LNAKKAIASTQLFHLTDDNISTGCPLCGLGSLEIGHKGRLLRQTAEGPFSFLTDL
jgi:hypothetical protein